MDRQCVVRAPLSRVSQPARAVLSIESVRTVDSLPDALFAASDSLFSTKAWWRTVMADATPPGAAPVFMVCRTAGAPAGLFPMFGANSFTTPYTCLYTPLILGDAAAVCEAFARHCRGRAVTRLDALPAEWPHLPALIAGARTAGLAVRRFGHFGNWHEDVAGLSWAAYLAHRPGALRETIRRRLRRAEQHTDARFTLIDSAQNLNEGIAAFEAIYAKSWKEPEPFPRFNAALMRTASAMGILRLGVWSLAEQPVAAQFWIVEHGKATVLKLAHDEAFKTHSPGTVLTALMLRHLLDRERVNAIDFGRGDDPYKRDWASARRQRIGLLLINPRRPAGLLALARHDLGRAIQRLRSAREAT